MGRLFIKKLFMFTAPALFLLAGCIAAPVKTQSQQEYFTQTLNRTNEQLERVLAAFDDIAPCPPHNEEGLQIRIEDKETYTRQIKELAKSYPNTLNTALESYAIYLAALYPYQNNTFAPDSLEHQAMKRELPQIFEEAQSAVQDILKQYEEESLRLLHPAAGQNFEMSCLARSDNYKARLAALKPLHEQAVKNLGATYTALYKNLPKKNKEEALKQCSIALRPYNAQLYTLTITGKNTEQGTILTKTDQIIKQCTKK